MVRLVLVLLLVAIATTRVLAPQPVPAPRPIPAARPGAAPQPGAAAPVIRPCCIRLPYDGAATDFVLDLRYTIRTNRRGGIASVGPMRSRANIDLLNPSDVERCVRSWTFPPSATCEARIQGRSYEPVVYEVWRRDARLSHAESAGLCAGPRGPACPHPAGIITATVGWASTLSPPRLLSRTAPDVSRLKTPWVSGVVILEAGIDRAGTVRSVCVLRSVRPDVDEAAAAALRRWTWKPATMKQTENPVAIALTVTVGPPH